MSIVMDRPKGMKSKPPATAGTFGETPATQPTACCANCRFFVRFRRRGEHESGNQQKGQGHCRRYPPNVHAIMDSHPIPLDPEGKKSATTITPLGWRSSDPASGQSEILLLPIVPADFFCGEHQRGAL